MVGIPPGRPQLNELFNVPKSANRYSQLALAQSLCH
jgi:hypothetical protein